MKHEWLHLITGKLAAQSLEETIQPLSAELGFDYSIDVLPITVAALMTPDWIARHIDVPPQTTQILIPGYCTGDLAAIGRVTDRKLVVGPKDLRALPRFLGASDDPRLAYGDYSIEILAEINHAPALSADELQRQALALRQQGADLIDVGCTPGTVWKAVGDGVRSLIDLGLRVSVDSMNRQEIQEATRAGAELVLSVNSQNREAAPDWGCEVVAIPDDPHNLDSLSETIQFLDAARVPYRLDPIIEPIGFGFLQSLARYIECRRRFPQAAMLMGIGNLTELTSCDSAGINLLLLSICEELQIRSVLTTQVIEWARTSVQECDIARRLAHYAVVKGRLPKHIDDRLVMLRDPELLEHPDGTLDRLADEIRDNNYRVYADSGQIHLITRGTHLAGSDPFALLREVEARQASGALPPLTASHAFYLGHELCKARLAIQLGKQYRQDEPLDWGFLTSREAPSQRHT